MVFMFKFILFFKLTISYVQFRFSLFLITFFFLCYSMPSRVKTLVSLSEKQTK